MFDYTKTVVEKIKNDFVALIKLFQFATQILYLIYLAYALIRGNGILWVNISLLILSLAFLGYSIYMLTQQKPNRQINRRIKRVIAWCKRIIKLYPLGVMTYTVYATTQSVDTLSVILTALMLVAWVLGIVFELITYFLISRFEWIMEGMKADLEGVSKVTSFFKRLKGEEVPTPQEPSKQRRWLDEQVAQKREQRAQQKLEYKAEKKREKKQRKLDKKQAKNPPVELVEEVAPKKRNKGEE